MTNTHEITEKFESVKINTDTADVELRVSEDGLTKVVCSEGEKAPHTVAVDGGVLCVINQNNRRWYDYIRLFNFTKQKVTVYLPAGDYETLTVKTGTGEVKVPDGFGFASADISASTGRIECRADVSGELKIKATTGAVAVRGIEVGAFGISVSTGAVEVCEVECAGRFSIKVSTGRTTVADVRCESFVSEGSTGDITLTDVIVENEMELERSTGDIVLERCDAGEIIAETDTGDVTGSLLSEKIFVVRSDTGRIEVPESYSGAKCKVTTDTGDIRFSVIG